MVSSVCVSLPCKDFIHADHTVEQGAHLLSTALASFSELDLVGRRVLSVNFWRSPGLVRKHGEDVQNCGDI